VADGQPFPSGGFGVGEQFAGLAGVLAVDGEELGGGGASGCGGCWS
jgi:hypothetical protein